MSNLIIRNKRWAALAPALALVIMAFFGCSSQPQPKDTVMDFFAALHGDDTAMVRATVDPQRAFAAVQNDLRESGDSLATDIDWGERLVASLTGEGRLRQRWLKTQVVINKAEVFGDSATVEVSFLDQETKIYFYNKMGLVRRPERWVIVAFRTM